MNMQVEVQQRYAGGAKQREEELCCPVDYDASLMEMLPREIIDKDYGCGDPSRYVREGDIVLDLGCGGGKICYMAAQLVGPRGRVIGVDMTDDMLSLARKYQDEMAAKLGGNRVDFYKGYIQDLALDVDAMEAYLAQHPVRTADNLGELQQWQRQQRQDQPLIADNSVDLVVSNCVLNLVSDEEKQQLVKEIFRVLKPGGRVAISDIISDEVVPPHLKQNTELWSGCISGAFQEQEFISAFIDAGFLAVTYDKWDAQPWRVVEGIEFRSVTLTAVKGEESPCLDYGHAVIYKGPYAEIQDDEGHVFPRGERMAVCERTFNFLTASNTYGGDFIGIEPAQRGEARTFCAPSGTRRPVAETRGGTITGGATSGSCC